MLIPLPNRYQTSYPFAAFQPFVSAGWTIISPITAPKKIFPPKTCAADTATSTGKNAKDVLEAMSKNAYQSVDAKEGIALPNASTNPIIKPAATIAGRIGTNTSPSVLINCFHHGI